MNIRNALLTLAGSVLVALGVIGIFLPLLPTTPFLILAAMAFSAGNEKMYDRLMRTRHVGEYIRNYRDGTGVSKSTKILSLAYLWAFLALSACFMRDKIWVLAILAAVGISVTAHVAMLRGALPVVPDGGRDGDAGEPEADGMRKPSRIRRCRDASRSRPPARSR